MEKVFGKLSELCGEIEVNTKLARELLSSGVIPSIKTGSKARRRYYTTKTLVAYAAKAVQRANGLPENTSLKKTFLSKTKHLNEDIFKIAEKDRSCTVLCVTNQKGGVGKTTDAINLGIALAKLGQKTLVMDMDSQSQSSRYINRGDDELSFEGRSLVELFNMVIQRKPISRETVRKYIATFDDIEGEGYSIDVLPSEIKLARLMEIARTIPNPEKILYKEIIMKIEKDYDFIIIDTPPSASLSLSSSLYAADTVIISTETNRMAEEGMRVTIEEIAFLSKNIEKEIDIGAVIINSFTMANKMNAKYLQKTVDNAVAEGVEYSEIYKVKSSPSLVSETQDLGVPIIESRKKVRETIKVVEPFLCFAISLIESKEV